MGRSSTSAFVLGLLFFMMVCVLACIGVFLALNSSGGIRYRARSRTSPARDPYNSGLSAGISFNSSTGGLASYYSTVSSGPVRSTGVAASFVTGVSDAPSASRFAALSLDDQKRDLLELTRNCQAAGMAFSEELAKLGGRSSEKLPGEKHVCNLALEIINALKTFFDACHGALEKAGSSAPEHAIRSTTEQHMDNIAALTRRMQGYASKYPEAYSKYKSMSNRELKGSKMSQFFTL